jgi:hypothetical protein
VPRGSSSRSGPAPDPTALRRERDSGEWVDLPASGREGPPPEFPLTEQTAREAELWESEWRRPQAVMWERNGQELEVALYVRSVRDAERLDAPVNARTLVRQQMDALGLTVPGLRGNRWRIVSEAAKPKSQPPGSRPPSAKERLRLIDGAA